jgi:hypothetical protein
MLQAYFDESGTHPEAKVTAIAGYVATADVWNRVEDQWQQILKPHAHLGLTWWHMSEFRAGHGQYERVGVELGTRILNDLVSVIRESDLQVIWAGLDNDDYVAAAPRDLQERCAPYDYCFYWIMRQLAVWSGRRGYDGNIGMMFAIQDQYNKRSESALKSWQAFGLLENLRPLAFDYPRLRPALQPADILSNEMYRLLLRYKSGASSAPSQLLCAISQNRLQEGGFIIAETIRHYIADPHTAWAYPKFREISG